MHLKYIQIIILCVVSVTSYSQFSVSFDYNKKKLVNWKTNENINKRYSLRDSSILFFGGKNFCMQNKHYFFPSNDKIYTFEFLLLIDSNTIDKRIGEIGITYEYKNEYDNVKINKLFRSDSLMIDTLKSKKWYKFSKSFYLKDIEVFKFGFYYKKLSKESSNFYIKEVNLKQKNINEYFENNLILNGDFEVNNIEPDGYFTLFNFVPFWESNINSDTVLHRESLYNYVKILRKNNRWVSAGTPDLISNYIYYSKEGNNLKFGKYCAKLLLPNFRTSKSGGGEYLQNELKEELKKDTLYELILYLKLSQHSGYTINNLGALFSEYPYDTYDSLFYKNHLHKSDLFFTNDYLEVSQDWLEFKINYKASGKEKYVLIGCFENGNGSNTDKKYHSPKKQIVESPIVYIDNISLKPISQPSTRKK